MGPTQGLGRMLLNESFNLFDNLLYGSLDYRTSAESLLELDTMRPV
jgi:hypothetical protein